MKESVGDLLDYITWRGDLSFAQSPFCEVDALVLAQLSYNHFDGLLKGDFSYRTKLFDLYSAFTGASDYESRCQVGAVINSNTPELLKAASASNRFGLIEICGYESILDEEKEEQFAAMTFILDKKTAVVVFRGTDDTVLGWKEDFNIIFQKAIPSQISGVEYLNRASRTLKQDILVSGHSKGGSVAMFAAINCDAKVQKKIKSVYNFDGPGFTEDFYKRPQFLNVKDKIHSFYPYFSVVGMVFHHPENYKIIDSTGFTVFQHDAFSWNISGKDFVYCDDFADESKIFHQSFNDWMEELSLEDRKRFVDVFFDVIYASGAKTNLEIERNKLQASAKMIAAIGALAPEDRKHVTHIIHMFLKTGKNNIPIFTAFKPEINLKSNIEEVIEKLKDK